MILGIATTILGLIGVYGFFNANLLLVIIGGTAGIIENLIGIMSGQQKSLATAIIAIIAGIIYSSSIGLPFWVGALIGMCFESAIMGVISIAGLLIAVSVMNKE